MSRSPSSSLTFGRPQRVTWSAEFERLRKNGRRLVKGCLIFNWMEQPGKHGELLRLGVITPKRIGSAVLRSRARRVMREAFRLTQHQIKKPLTMILVARQSIAGRASQEVRRDLVALLRQARLLDEEA